MRENDFNEAQAARILNISASTLRRYRLAGKIGHHRWPGGRVTYTTDQLTDFRSSCRVDPMAGNGRT